MRKCFEPYPWCVRCDTVQPKHRIRLPAGGGIREMARRAAYHVAASEAGPERGVARFYRRRSRIAGSAALLRLSSGLEGSGVFGSKFLPAFLTQVNSRTLPMTEPSIISGMPPLLAWICTRAWVFASPAKILAAMAA